MISSTLTVQLTHSLSRFWGFDVCGFWGFGGPPGHQNPKPTDVKTPTRSGPWKVDCVIPPFHSAPANPRNPKPQNPTRELLLDSKLILLHSAPANPRNPKPQNPTRDILLAGKKDNLL